MSAARYNLSSVMSRVWLSTYLEVSLEFLDVLTANLQVVQGDLKTNKPVTITGHMADNKPVSQSCAVAKSDKFCRVTGQSTLAEKMEDCSIGQSAVV